MKPSKRYAKYWICHDCAKEKGLIAPTGAVTCILGRCGHCTRIDQTTLTPVCDYEDPKTGRKPMWD